MVDDLSSLILQLDQAYTLAFNKNRLMLAELDRNNQKLERLIGQNKERLQGLEGERAALIADKNNLEMEIEEIYR